ncbi:aminotransferase class V-fold PLP-dependent enzyme [Streptomyces sp. NPDC101165]|uniref:aminotransferase class V-fold PLP-dependent enzyme n=1 Tax=Streptomyces sp. NPDC101165 TaxID=3366119 RepID=UPI0038296931
MRQQSNASLPAGESLLDTAAEIAALRADTPGCESVIHFNNAGCGLVTRPVLAAMTDHLRLEADIGGYEASAAREVQVRDFYASIADLLGLLYLVDACQSVGQYAIDVAEIGCDLLIATCRKFLRGPRGSGFLYVSDRVLREGYEPLFIDMYGARWVEPDTYRPVDSAARFEEWEFPYATLLGCAAAVRYALRVGLEPISRRTPALAARLRDRLADIPGIRLLDRGPAPAALVTFEVEGWQPQPFKTALDERGINSALSFREFAQYDFDDKDVDWCLRLSPHYYNTEDEVDTVATAVAELAEHVRRAR